MAYEQPLIPIDGSLLNALGQDLDISTSSDTESTSTSPISDPSVITDLLKQYFPNNWQIMYQIAQKESGLDPMAYNPEKHDNVCSGSIGLFQIGCDDYSGSLNDLFDIETNIKVAKEVYDKQSYGAWGVCTKKLVIC